MSFANCRFYFTCFFIFVGYFTLVVLQISEYTNEDANFGSQQVFLNRSIVATEVNDKQFCRAPRVAILVSPQSDRVLQLFWDLEYVQEGDWIGLFQEDPQSGKEVFPIYTVLVQNTTGLGITNVTYANVTEELTFTSTCLKYWVGYFSSSGTAVAVSCLKTHPTWMYDIRDQLNDLQIKRAFIPGTHDSGSYSKFSDEHALDVVGRYVFTQEEDILSQLIHGIRYLDLRVSFNTNLPDRWWINHGIVRVQPLKKILDDIKHFLRHTKEIIIIDIHEFPLGFESKLETHRDLVQYLKSELSDWVAPPDWSATFGQLWAKNKPLIISYNNDHMVREHSSLLWSPVVHKWANAQGVDKLKEFFNKVIDNRSSYSWAAMAELTPTVWSILTYQTISLRNMAYEVNPHITNWFRGKWGKMCNVVAVDFFRGTDVVQTAIEWNVRRNGKHICDIR